MFRLKTFDWSLIILPLVLTILGITTIYTITYNNVGLKLALSQIIYTVIGFGLLVGFTFFDYRQLKGLALPLFLVGLVLLVPMLPSLSHKVPLVICEFNACRWLNMGFFQFQTSELFKLIIIIFFAALLSTRQRKPWWYLFVCVGILLIPLFLIMEQPDLGTSLVIVFCALIIMLASRFPVFLWILLLAAFLISLPIGWKQLKPYQRQRIEVFLNPEIDPNKTGYNVRQAEIAVGSGGVWGRGFGKGSQSQLNFLPVAHTDFIFAGYAEATGYAGSMFLIGAFLFLIWRVLNIAQVSKDLFGQLVALGIAAMLFIQVFINIGMNIRLMPVTGIPLPLFSYGGTSLFVTMIALGILQSIVIRHKKISFE